MHSFTGAHNQPRQRTRRWKKKITMLTMRGRRKKRWMNLKAEGHLMPCTPSKRKVKFWISFEFVLISDCMDRLHTHWLASRPQPVPETGQDPTGHARLHGGNRGGRSPWSTCLHSLSLLHWLTFIYTASRQEVQLMPWRASLPLAHRFWQWPPCLHWVSHQQPTGVPTVLLVALPPGRRRPAPTRERRKQVQHLPSDCRCLFSCPHLHRGSPASTGPFGQNEANPSSTPLAADLLAEYSMFSSCPMQERPPPGHGKPLSFSHSLCWIPLSDPITDFTFNLVDRCTGGWPTPGR